MSGPSRTAVAAAAPVVDGIADGSIRSSEEAEEAARDVLDRAHDPALGLDRSVCLRDVLELLNVTAQGWPQMGYDRAARLLQEELG